MGNCTSGKKKRKKEAPDAEAYVQHPQEDVTYASIDHSSVQTTNPRATVDNDCDYATVNVPRAFQKDAEPDCLSREDCADDYVIMS